tara:strand:+ start:7509 stop:8048 length:540 start_codon:yes stop_codon:yes gene_type:complete
MKTYYQKHKFSSPWSFKKKVLILIWEWTWILFCRWTPKNFNLWRLQVLKLFAAKIYGKPFVHQRCIISHPWNLTLYDRSCLGDGTMVYALDSITVQEHAIIAQEAFLCTGTHDFTDTKRPLKTDSIVIGKNVFIGARAFIFPGIIIGDNALVGACSVVTKNVLNNSKVLGNPARIINNV